VSAGAAHSISRLALRVLTFRVTRDELLRLDGRHLVFGLVSTWLVGMGRYWDHPSAHLLQYLGLGSVVYVFVLAAAFYLSFAALRAEDWSYQRVLTFITLTSPPALLYAIPVERFLSLSDARTANVWFLATVASWRVALFLFFVRRLTRLSYFRVVTGTLLPIACIIFVLTVLNLEHAVFDIMAGLRENEGTANDRAYEVLVLLTFLSFSAAPFLVLAWIWAAATSRKRKARP